jgi:hypothetical protein
MELFSRFLCCLLYTPTIVRSRQRCTVFLATTARLKILQRCPQPYGGRSCVKKVFDPCRRGSSQQRGTQAWGINLDTRRGTEFEANYQDELYGAID